MIEEELTAKSLRLLLNKIESYRSEYPAVYFTSIKQQPHKDEDGVWRCVMSRATSCD